MQIDIRCLHCTCIRWPGQQHSGHSGNGRRTHLCCSRPASSQAGASCLKSQQRLTGSAIQSMPMQVCDATDRTDSSLSHRGLRARPSRARGRPLDCLKNFTARPGLVFLLPRLCQSIYSGRHLLFTTSSQHRPSAHFLCPFEMSVRRWPRSVRPCKNLCMAPA